MRKPIIAANWKMNLGPESAADFLEVFLHQFPSKLPVEVVLCPTFVAIPLVSQRLNDVSSVLVGAQNMSDQDSGAFTGETSAMMLKELFVRFVILGHSERRALYGETDAMINAKLKKALDAKLKPLFCIGETLEERDAGQLEVVLRRQLTDGLADICDKEILNIVVAYEPVWAIGTGRTASAEQAQEAHAFVRQVLKELYGEEVSEKIRIQYGGSVKPSNVAELMAQPDIDGALVGGASLDPNSFLQIVMNTVAVAEAAE